MVCIYCGNSTKVTNSRPNKKLRQVWRRRHCLKCTADFTTIENYELCSSIIVAKRSGELQPFYRDKLFLSVYFATNHLKDNIRTSNDLVNTVLRHLLNKSPLSPKITSIQISNVVLGVLKRYDAASSIKYASYQQKMSSYQDITKSLRSN